MRFIILDELFDKYVEPLSETFMTGEVPTVTFLLFRSGTKESNWLSYTRFKNSGSVSIYRCEVYMDDVMLLCRRCKIYLITKPIFTIMVLYSVLHPLYQTQYTDWKHEDDDYDSMMSAAGKQTYRFIKDNFKFNDPQEELVLEILKYNMMLFTNKFYGLKENENPKKIYENLLNEYKTIMLDKYHNSYVLARYFKAQTYLINTDGFIVLEKKGDNKYGEKFERKSSVETCR